MVLEKSLIRHGDQYSTSFIVSREEAENALESARKFVNRLEKLINIEKKKKQS